MITIHPGQNKKDQAETFAPLALTPGIIYSVVGPTGSGKTQLLDDIERLSPGDGVTKRRVTSSAPVHIHHLSQKMHYMVDMPVEAFVTLYAQSIGQADATTYCRDIITMANTLCGEPLSGHDPLTRLSGGQSRALMIATVAMSPEANVVLLDEIENAGINRLNVLKTLSAHDKVVLMITHDPLLALQADRRIVLKNGGIAGVIDRTDEEKNLCAGLLAMDTYLSDLRQTIRAGHHIDTSQMAGANTSLPYPGKGGHYVSTSME